MADWNPERYGRRFDTPLGRMVDADEKALLFGLADLKRGDDVLDLGCGDGSYTVPAAERTGLGSHSALFVPKGNQGIDPRRTPCRQ